MGNRSYPGTVLGDVVGAAAWGSRIYTLRGGLDGCEQMYTLHAGVVLLVGGLGHFVRASRGQRSFLLG